MRVQRFERFDASSLRSPVRMDNGFLKVEGRIARVGIQEYQDSTGKTHKELRLPEDVFDEESLSSFKQVPVTNRHPPGMLTAKNTKKYAVGNVGESVRRDETFVAAPLMVTDEEAIAAIEAGRSQLSNGYTCRLDVTTPELVAKHGPHDFVQREIRGNHVAIVDVGRAGPEACLRLDSADSASSGFGRTDVTDISSQVTHQGDRLMAHKMKLDGFEIEVADQNAQAIIERAIASARKDESDKSQKLISELQAKCDMAVVRQKEDADKLAAMPALVLSQARDLAVLLETAKIHLGTNQKLDGDEIAIKRLVIAKLAPKFNLDDRDDNAIRAAFDLAISSAPAPITSLEAARASMLQAAKADESEKPNDPEEARRKMIELERSANVKARR